MKKLFLAALISLLLFASITLADIPRYINVQGILIDPSTGEPPSGSSNVLFEVYNSSGVIWSETQSIDPDDDTGLFNAELGRVSGGIVLPFNQPYFIEISVNGQKLLPRINMTSVAYAFSASRLYTSGNYYVVPESVSKFNQINASAICLDNCINSWPTGGAVADVWVNETGDRMTGNLSFVLSGSGGVGRDAIEINASTQNDIAVIKTNKQNFWIWSTNTTGRGAEDWANLKVRDLITSNDLITYNNLRFDGEIQPDGATCSNGQILKKTAANKWVCASDIDTNANTLCSGTSVYLDGDGNCDTLYSYPGDCSADQVRVAGVCGPIPDCDGESKTLNYDTTTHTFSCLNDESGGGVSLWSQNVNDIYYNTGNVGIGTSSPDSRLEVESGRIHVTHSSTTEGTLWVTQSSSGYGVYQDGSSAKNYFQANVGIGDLSPDARLDILNTGTGASFRVDDSSDGETTPFIIDADGRVGIGTASPDPYFKLDVNGKIATPYLKSPNTGDINKDGFVNALDYNIFTSAFSINSLDPEWNNVIGVDNLANEILVKDCDLDGNNYIDIMDAIFLSGNYNNYKVFKIEGWGDLPALDVKGNTILQVNDNTNSGVSNVLKLIHTTDGIPANGLGTGIIFQGEISAGTRNMSQIASVWTDVNDASRDSDLIFSTVLNGVLNERMRISSNGRLYIGNNYLYKSAVPDALAVYGSFAVVNGDLTVSGDTTISGKLTAGGIDPPYVSFSSESHKSIREYAKDVEGHERVMIFWNDEAHRIEVYNLSEDRFYTITGELIEE
jgi:hypothetical protein